MYAHLGQITASGLKQANSNRAAACAAQGMTWVADATDVYGVNNGACVDKEIVQKIPPAQLQKQMFVNTPLAAPVPQSSAVPSALPPSPVAAINSPIPDITKPAPIPEVQCSGFAAFVDQNKALSVGGLLVVFWALGGFR